MEFWLVGWLLWMFLFFGNRVSLCIPGWPGINFRVFVCLFVCFKNYLFIYSLYIPISTPLLLVPSPSPSPLRRGTPISHSPHKPPTPIHQSLQDCVHPLLSLRTDKVAQLEEQHPEASNKFRSRPYSGCWETCMKTKMHICCIRAGVGGKVRSCSLFGWCLSL